MAVVRALERTAHYFFGLGLCPQAAQLLGISQYQGGLLTLCRGQLLPGQGQRLQPGLAARVALRRQAKVLPPGAAFKLSQFLGRQDFVFTQLRQQADQGRPVAALLVQALKLAQHLHVMRMAFVHGLQGVEGAFGIGAINLQLRMVEGNRQFGLGLTLKGALKQAVAFFVTALLIGRTRGTEVEQQRLALGFCGAGQVFLRAGPAALGQVHLALFDRQLNATAAVTP